MNKQILSFLEKKTKFLVERHSLIKAIFVYGSAARKNKKPNDVDCVAIVDDTSEKFKPTVLDYIETELREITEEADKKMKIDLHFQSPRPLSVWWDSLRSGEPWVMTAVKDAYILYDPSDYIAPLKSLVNQGRITGTKEKAHALIERAPHRYKEAQRIMLDEVTEELLSAMTETAQAVLMFFGIAPPAAKDIPKALRKNFVERKLIDESIAVCFEDFYETTNKISHREITKLSGKEVKKLLHKAVFFIDRMDDLFSLLEIAKKKDIIEESYSKAIHVCKTALKLEEPKLNSETLKKFKKEFVDSGFISTDYLNLLKNLSKMKNLSEKGKLGEIPEKDIYSSVIYTKSLEEILRKRKK